MTRPDVVDASARGKQEVDEIRRRFAEFNAAEEHLAVARRRAGTSARRGRPAGRRRGLLFSGSLLVALAAYLRRRVLRPVHRVADAAGRWPTAASTCASRSPDAARSPAGGRRSTAWPASLAERERELRVTNDRLQGILDHATTSSASEDLEGRYLLVNRRWVESPASPRRRLGRTDPDCSAPSCHARRASRTLEVLRSRDVVEFEREVELHGAAAATGSSSSRCSTPTASPTRVARCPPTSPSTSARSPTRSRRRARSRSSWPT